MCTEGNTQGIFLGFFAQVRFPLIVVFTPFSDLHFSFGALRRALRAGGAAKASAAPIMTNVSLRQ